MNLPAHHHQFLSDQIPHGYAHFLRVALDRKKLANLAERKPELLRPLDKLQVGNLAIEIETVPARRASRAGQQPLFFIKADRIDAEPGLQRHLPDL